MASDDNGHRRHICHAWADGVRCWICSAWSQRSMSGACRLGPPISLSFVPQHRSCTMASARDRAEEGSDQR